MNNSPLQAVIFDWDGVVIDSSKYHEMSWDIVAKPLGLTLPEGHFKKGFGKRNEQIIPEILGWATEKDQVEKLAFLKEEAYRKLLFEKGIDALPGIRELLMELQKGKVKFGVGSSTPKENLLAGVKVLSLQGTFEVMVSGDDVDRGKPDPEVFLKVAGQIGVNPSACVVLEDSHSGLEAARRAGMKCVGIATTHPACSLEADLIVQNPKEISLDVLKQLWN